MATNTEIEAGDTVELTIDLNGDTATNTVDVLEVSHSGKGIDVENANGDVFMVNLRVDDGEKVGILQQHGNKVCDVTEMELV